MTIKLQIEEIRGLVDEANRLSRKGENEEALQLLRETWNELEYLNERKAELLRGLICHYRGRVLQRMGQYEEAVEELQEAAGYRKDNPIDYAYTMFQLFICKIYGKIPISDKETKETKMALLEAVVDNTASIQDIGNMMQNIGYIEQVKGSIEKAILFYEMSLRTPQSSVDEHGSTLTKARLAECYKRLAECYKEIGKNEIARAYAGAALSYFNISAEKEIKRK